MSNLDKMFGEQIKGLSEVEILEKIEEAKTVGEMNKLRENCVKLLNSPFGKAILQAWQKKYWALKNCPTCGRPKDEKVKLILENSFGHRGYRDVSKLYANNLYIGGIDPKTKCKIIEFEEENNDPT